jgi:ATP-dependent RNA helicase DDX24/MAK5
VIKGSDYKMEQKADGQMLFRILTPSEKEKKQETSKAKSTAAAAGTSSKTTTTAATSTNDKEVKKSKKRKKPKDAKATDTPMEEEESTSAPASDSTTPATATTLDTTTDPETSNPKKKKRRKQKKKPKADSTTNESAGMEQETSEQDDPRQISALQMSWTTATAGCQLHPELAAALLQQSFWTPTPIQAAVLPAAILGRRNIVGAAPTGSGKTLAFLLPICQYLLEQRDEKLTIMDNDKDDSKDNKIQALIVTPTRELAMQIHAEAAKLLGTGVNRMTATTNTKTSSVNHHLTGLIVGGLAHAKQQRVLEKSRPPIIVATPGRLWELVRLSLYLC